MNTVEEIDRQIEALAALPSINVSIELSDYFSDRVGEVEVPMLVTYQPEPYEMVCLSISPEEKWAKKFADDNRTANFNEKITVNCREKGSKEIQTFGELLTANANPEKGFLDLVDCYYDVFYDPANDTLYCCDILSEGLQGQGLMTRYIQALASVFDFFTISMEDVMEDRTKNLMSRTHVSGDPETYLFGHYSESPLFKMCDRLGYRNIEIGKGANVPIGITAHKSDQLRFIIN